MANGSLIWKRDAAAALYGIKNTGLLLMNPNTGNDLV
ncbi:MAG: hypothetical protein ACJAXY_001685 [Nonlabens sp.]|jgi:hypothetical protein